MTVVVCDGAHVVVDSGGFSGDVVHRVQKWERTNGGIIIRVGNSMVSGALAEWYKKERSEFPNGAKLADGLAELIVVFVDVGGGLSALRYSTSEVPDVMMNEWAFGSGRDFAYGNLYGTHDAVNAAYAACHYSPHCALPLDVFTLINGKIKHEVRT
jgi:hypothetical protein